MSEDVGSKETVDAAHVVDAEGTEVHDDSQDEENVQAVLIHQYGRYGNQQKWQRGCYGEDDSKMLLRRQSHCR